MAAIQLLDWAKAQRGQQPWTDPGSRLAEDPPSPPFLDLLVDIKNRSVARRGEAAVFGRQLKAWELFLELYGAGLDGKSRADLLSVVWPGEAVLDNVLDQRKADVNELLLPLHVEVFADNRGIWTIREISAR